MILAIDIGNTNIVVGGVDEKQTYFVERLSTVRTKTELEYAIDIKVVLDLYGIEYEQIQGGIISSVVPQITNIMRIATEKILRRKVLVVGPGIKTGLNILMDNPAQLGSDLVADSVAAINEYSAPLIVFDMGTATTVCVIDENRNYIGDDPARRTRIAGFTDDPCGAAAGISLEPPKHMIGKNTIDCMKSGVIYSSAAMVDGLITRIEDELGKKATAIATGGLAKFYYSSLQKRSYHG